MAWCRRGDPFAPTQRAWWTGLELNATERLAVRQDFTLLTSLTPLISELDQNSCKSASRLPGPRKYPTYYSCRASS